MSCLDVSFREKCPNTTFFLVRIFLYLDWISIFTPNTGKYGAEKTPYLDTFTQCLSNYYQKQPPKVFCKKGVLNIFANFTEKHLCWCLSLMKVFFCKICKTFKEHLFRRTSAKDCLFITMENLISKSKVLVQ